jgi:hypothetical protein
MGPNVSDEHPARFFNTDDGRSIVACRPVARQRPRNKQLYNSRLRKLACFHSNNGRVVSYAGLGDMLKQNLAAVKHKTVQVTRLPL